MNSEPTTKPSKIGPVLVSVLIVAIVAGAMTLLYLRNNNGSTVTQAPATTTSTPATPTDPVLTSGSTITTTLSDLDTQLAQIDNDLKSTDDTSPTL